MYLLPWKAPAPGSEEVCCAAVRTFLDDEQLVEPAPTIAYYNKVVRFLEPMQVDLKQDGRDD